jgi:outer membrane protein OmpA-like peptidoglycan-associated protein/Mg-chelatase subunit ChlD
MRNRWIFILLSGLLLAGQAFAADAADLHVTSGRQGAVVAIEKAIDDGKVVVSVSDAANNPLFGLTANDFVVTAAGRTAKITSVQPLSESLEVPRNIVLVLDNSDSMRQRNAIEPLRAGVDELLKIVRPIDKVQIVVFSSKQKIIMDGRELRVRTFSSNRPADLKNFVAEVYGEGITAKTVLYEAMLAGLGLLRTMPADEPRFMVVFSDGEDLNSAYKEGDVFAAMKEAGGFHAYAIDYMPGMGTDKFLAAFAERNHGQIWKATSETNLVPIFQSVASKMQYYYVVSYLFPTTGSLAVAPTSLNIDEVENFDASTAARAQTAGASVVSRIDAPALTLRPAVDSAYGIASWKVTLANSGGALAEQAGEGMPAAEIAVPFKTDDLGRLASGGDITATMEVKDSKGQSIVLTAPPVKVNHYKTSGSLTVAPVSLTIEEIKTIDASPMLGHIYFAEDSSDLPEHYVRLSGPGETAAFEEQRFRDTLEKYYEVLNIIGKRMVDHPEATITLTGCNANTGAEKGNRKLSLMRAGAVRDYLQSVWGIAPGRMKVEARNLPKMPSTSRLEEGQAENRRVEISSDDPAILALIKSTYLTTRIDTSTLTARPVVNAAHGVAGWMVAAANSKQKLGELTGQGDPAAEIKLPLNTGNLTEMAAAGDITVRMQVKDKEGQELTMTARPVKVTFIQTSERLAKKQDFRVQEKYALILFDFDSDAIDARNQEIVNTIVGRIKELPQATAAIVGHTDNIGKENYNIKLSERRALAVYRLLKAAYGEDPGERITHRGVGPNDPLYDNSTPEARAFNRTVTITLEYMTGSGAGPEQQVAPQQ